MKMVRRLFPVVTAALVALATVRMNAWPEADAAVGRALAKRYVDTVVSVELVAKIMITAGDRPSTPQEQKAEVNGTVVSADGLTVAPLSGIDPRSALEAMRGRANATGQRLEISETEYKEVKLRLADGTEVPAKVVLKDADLDLAFIMPDEPAGAAKRTFAAVNLDDAAEGVLLGNYFVVSRASKTLQRVPVVRMVSVEGIAEKPRKLFLVGGTSIGSPVFDPQGHILGICLTHISNGRAFAPIVLPAADIAEIAKQAAVAAKQSEAAKPAEETKPAN